MSIADAPAVPIRAAAPRDPQALNGDDRLSPEECRAYVDFHAARNRANADRSRRERVRTRPIPLDRAPVAAAPSPARAMLAAFFRHAARTLRPAFEGRPVTILDLGCGGGPCLEYFESEGYRGHYIGIDLCRSPKWSDASTAGFSRSLVLGDIHTLDLSGLPAIDLLVSATSLEHIRDDAGAIARLARLLRPGGAQAHFVPGEAALPLYGPHGWRQYSPLCLRQLFPHGEIYRTGGPFSSAIHLAAITRPVGRRRPMMYERRPGVYRALRAAALRLDRLTGNSPASMYGVICGPTA